MQKLLDEINQVKNDVEVYLNTQKETSDGNQTEIRNFNENINDLRTRMDAMARGSDSNWPMETFDQVKRDALDTLSNLSKRLHEFNQHFEETVDVNARPFAPTKGIEALASRHPLIKPEDTTSSSSSDEEAVSDEESVVLPNNRNQGTSNSPQVVKFKEASTSSEEDDSEDEDEESENKNSDQSAEPHRKHITNDHNYQSRTSTPLHKNMNPPPVQLHSSSSSSSLSSTSTQAYVASNRHKLTASNQTPEQSLTEDDDDDEPGGVDMNLRQLRRTTYTPGTLFRVLRDFAGEEIGDLAIHKDEHLILVKQHDDDDWWLFKNAQTQREGLVPINYIQPSEKVPNQSRQWQPIAQTSSASSLVKAFKTNNNIPSGFSASSLTSLIKKDRYKLSYMLIPKMTESNLTFADLHWQYDVDRICAYPATYKKVLNIKKCSKIPKITGANIEILNRCIRICLYDGSEIISNIHSSRMKISEKSKATDITESWIPYPYQTLPVIDEGLIFLIRSNEYHPSKSLYLLIELSQFCQSTINEETCEIACGWSMIPLSNDLNRPLHMSGTMKYNECLQGGKFPEQNILLDSRYKTSRSNKRARIRFTLESREKYAEPDYDQLPLRSMIIPIDLVTILVFYRNELAYNKLQESAGFDGASSTPLHSIFLATFHRVLDQPDLIYVLQRLFPTKTKLTTEQQRKEILRIYESSVYPLLFYRSLPLYDFHNRDKTSIQERRKLILQVMGKYRKRRGCPPDVLELLLDPALTDKWAPFTIDEVCFSLQNYVLNS
ncbi:unnamed protein product [Adineta ricciae]|uniref:SH3 domain-containing protein n=1 Tax=Adineta ricciae TaxID=249248 RepID=A0A814K340_ADIRI|nr:unnamed protein product [Adineta ricciae]CAF1221651.1 unnamed protein product [Adineta ricciae]